MAGLLAAGELTSFLQQPVGTDAERTAIRVAEGWLRGAVPSPDPWPDPPPEDLWAWAIELAAIAYENPGGLESKTVGADTQTWPRARRSEILRAAGARYGGVAPAFSFPAVVPWS